MWLYTLVRSVLHQEKQKNLDKLWFVFSNVWGIVSPLQSPSLNGDEWVLGKPGLFGHKSQKKHHLSNQIYGPGSSLPSRLGCCSINCFSWGLLVWNDSSFFRSESRTSALPVCRFAGRVLKIQIIFATLLADVRQFGIFHFRDWTLARGVQLRNSICILLPKGLEWTAKTQHGTVFLPHKSSTKWLRWTNIPVSQNFFQKM